MGTRHRFRLMVEGEKVKLCNRHGFSGTTSKSIPQAIRNQGGAKADTTLSTPGGDALVLVRSEQLRQPVATAGGTVDSLLPPRCRCVIVHSRRLCPDAPAAERFSMVAES